MTMKVQVLLSTFNGEKYLLALLNSLATQAVDNLDILVRDDGSNDRTRSLVQNYALRTKSVRFLGGNTWALRRVFFS
jgi:rhamnosyltransferase